MLSNSAHFAHSELLMPKSGRHKVQNISHLGHFVQISFLNGEGHAKFGQKLAISLERFLKNFMVRYILVKLGFIILTHIVVSTKGSLAMHKEHPWEVKYGDGFTANT